MATNENKELEELIRNATGAAAASPAAPFASISAEEEDEAPGLDIATLVLVARRSLLWQSHVQRRARPVRQLKSTTS